MGGNYSKLHRRKPVPQQKRFMNFEFEFYFDYMFILTMYALDLQNSETLKDMFTIIT